MCVGLAADAAGTAALWGLLRGCGLEFEACGEAVVVFVHYVVLVLEEDLLLVRQFFVAAVGHKGFEACDALIEFCEFVL